MKRAELALIAQISATAAISLLAIRAAGAGTASVAVQATAYLIGAVALWAASRMARPGRGSRLISAAAILVVAVLMLTTGVEMQGAHRWLALGPVLIHPPRCWARRCSGSWRRMQTMCGRQASPP